MAIELNFEQQESLRRIKREIVSAVSKGTTYQLAASINVTGRHKELFTVTLESLAMIELQTKVSIIQSPTMPMTLMYDEVWSDLIVKAFKEKLEHEAFLVLPRPPVERVMFGSLPLSR